MSVTNITSDYIVPDIEEHFKVLAGPGAGKTHFLINHIRHLLNHSKRFLIQRKIACITYTNVATENIMARVGDHGGRLEISTMHSFLYKYIVKPYVSMIAAEFNLDAAKIDGHDDILFTSYSFINEWKQRTGQIYLDDKDIIAAWETLRWKFDAGGELIVFPKYPGKSKGYNFKTSSYLEYKKMVWEKGLLHHDDVLFFSHELMKRYPFILTVLRAIFPYLLIDEFQDCSPIQIKLVDLIAQKETIVGVIGDEAQSIYEFLGAVPGQLHSFKLPGIREYEIRDNHRSSIEIVDLLNAVRPALRQNSIRAVNTGLIRVLVGDKLAALQSAITRWPGVELVSLSRDNLTANAIKKGIGAGVYKNLLDDLKTADSNATRRGAVKNSTKAVEYAKMGYFKDALKTIGKMYNYAKTVYDQKRSLQALKILLDGYDDFAGKKVMDLYTLIQSKGIEKMSAFKAGGAKTFYENTPYDHLALAVKNPYEVGEHRTIHKAKGEEFDAVLVVLEADSKGKYHEAAELGFLLAPDLAGDEEHRVRYVAVSRAKDHLAIRVPSLSAASKLKLEALGIEVQAVK